MSDGSPALGACGLSCNVLLEGQPVAVGGVRRGLVKFEQPAVGSGVDQAWLAVNFYYGAGNYYQLNLYGYGAAAGALNLDAALANGQYAYLGSVDGSSAAEGAEVFFDVTSFVKATGSPYLAFVIESGSGLVVLSSLEVNYGHGSQLILTQVPEPGEGALLFAGLLTLAGWLWRRAV